MVGRGGHRGWGPWARLSEQVSLERWHLNQELKTKKERAIERFGANASHREMSSGSELSGEGESDMRGACKLPSIIWRIRSGETQESRGRDSEWKPREANSAQRKAGLGTVRTRVDPSYFEVRLPGARSIFIVIIYSMWEQFCTSSFLEWRFEKHVNVRNVGQNASSLSVEWFFAFDCTT